MTFWEREVPLTPAQQKAVWEGFMSRGSHHSAAGATLAFIVRRCEERRQPYRLTASPGHGYFIEPGENQSREVVS